MAVLVLIIALLLVVVAWCVGNGAMGARGDPLARLAMTALARVSPAPGVDGDQDAAAADTEATVVSARLQGKLTADEYQRAMADVAEWQWRRDHMGRSGHRS
jgi:hypothetical protein